MAEANRLEEEMQAVSQTSLKKDRFLTQKERECEELTNRFYLVGVSFVEITKLQNDLKDYESLKQTVEKLKQENSDTLDKQKQLCEEKNELEKEVLRLKEEGGDKDKKALLEDVATSNALIADLNEVNNQLKENVRVVTEEKEKSELTLATQKKTIELLQQQVDKLNHQLQSQLETMTVMKEEKKRIEEQVNELQKIQEESSHEYENEISKLENQLKQITEELSLTKQTALSEDMMEDDEDIMELEMELKQKEKMIEDLQKQVETLTAKKAENEERLASLQERCEASEVREKALSLKIKKEGGDDKSEQIRSLQEKLHSLEDQLKEKDDLERTVKEQAILESKLEELTQVNERKTEEVTQLSAMNKELSDRLTKSEEKWSNENETLQQTISSQVIQLKTLSDEKQVANKRIEELEKRINEVSQLEERCNDLEKEIQVMVESKDVSCPSLPSVQSEELSPTKMIILESLQKENDSLHQRVLELIVTREKAEMNAHTHQSTISFLKSSLESREKEVETLSRFLKEKDILIGQLKGRLAVYNVLVVYCSKQKLNQLFIVYIKAMFNDISVLVILHTFSILHIISKLTYELGPSRFIIPNTFSTHHITHKRTLVILSIGEEALTISTSLAIPPFTFIDDSSFCGCI